MDVSVHDDDAAVATVAALSIFALVNIGTVDRGKLNNSFLLIVLPIDSNYGRLKIVFSASEAEQAE